MHLNFGFIIMLAYLGAMVFLMWNVPMMHARHDQ